MHEQHSSHPTFILQYYVLISTEHGCVLLLRAVSLSVFLSNVSLTALHLSLSLCVRKLDLVPSLSVAQSV